MRDVLSCPTARRSAARHAGFTVAGAVASVGNAIGRSERIAKNPQSLLTTLLSRFRVS